MSKYFSEYKESIKFVGPLNPTEFKFHDECKEVGRITVKDGRMSFTGEVDESAKVFFDYLCNHFPQLKGEDNA